MPLLFAQLCDLLSALEDFSTRDPPLLPPRLGRRYHETLKSWFTTYRVSVSSPDIDAVMLLSALFPTKRTDRVYNTQLRRLTKLLKRCLCLGKDRICILDQWQTPGRGNLGDCVERALQQAEFPEPLRKDRVTLEQVDNLLATIAGMSRFSAPKVRRHEVDNDQEVLKLLGNTYQRMQSREAKWLTRLILKDFSCLDLKEELVYYHIDSRLPFAMQMYDDFEAAIIELRRFPASQMIEAGGAAWTQQCVNNAHLLQPRVGIKVGPPKWMKAKGGVKHAASMISGRTMSIERKYDGEYCQIHVDLNRGENCIQIFSKNGKDSTLDRSGVHKPIKDGLRIGHDDCGFSEKCIVEGELLVWSQKTKEILDFHKIRKHVSRSGSFLGTVFDSQPNSWENLMIVFYGVMLIDDEPVLHLPHRQRRQRLEKLVETIKGKAGIAWQKHVQFDTPDGPKRLKEGLAHAFVHRWEGLVLKPSDEPYFDFGRLVKGRYINRWIKLKKDCIKGLGDTADFAVIGGGYDITEAAKYSALDLLWTHFYIGCLRNKEAVLRSGVKPHFLIFAKVSEGLKQEDLVYLNQYGQFSLRAKQLGSFEVHETYNLDIEFGLPTPEVVFLKPFVFDVAGSGFDKVPNSGIFTLRFPRVLKLHQDRDWKQAIGLDELQAMATRAMTVSTGDLSREIAEWVEKLDQLDRGADGQLPSWDYTDDDNGDEEIYQKWTITPPNTKLILRARTPAAPPLVRMDTAEIRDQERGLSNSEVVERPTSTHSIAGITSNDSLQTSPRSSALSGSKFRFAKQQDSLTSPRKRVEDSAEYEVASRRSKKARLALVQTKSARRSKQDCANTTHKKPLLEVTNYARPSTHDRCTDPPKTAKQIPTTEFSELSKVLVGAHKDIYHRYNKSGRVMKPSSSARKTTASENNTANTTQQTVIHDVLSGPPSAPFSSAYGQETRNTTLPTPPSTAEHSMKDEILDIQQHQVFLSPCLMDPHHPLQELLVKHEVQYSAMPDGSMYAVSASPEYSIVFLTEPANAHLAGKHVHSLIKYVPHWHPRSIRVWDWRIMEAMLNDDIGSEAEKKKWINKCGLAKLSWAPEAEVVIIKWGDGEIRLIPRTELEQCVTTLPTPDGASRAA